LTREKILDMRLIHPAMKKTAFFFICLAALTLVVTAFKPAKYVVGDQALNFSLPSVDGRMISLSDLGDTIGYIVVFTSNHCPYAQLYEQRIISLHKKFASKGFPVVAINPNSPEIVPEDSFEAMKQRAADKRYPFQYLSDSNQTVCREFGATRTPQVFVLDSDRYVRYIGAIDDNPESPAKASAKYVESAVNALLRGQKPEVDFTRAIGCTISRIPPVTK
jgi:peroxiredoxin